MFNCKKLTVSMVICVVLLCYNNNAYGQDPAEDQEPQKECPTVVEGNFNDYYDTQDGEAPPTGCECDHTSNDKPDCGLDKDNGGTAQSRFVCFDKPFIYEDVADEEKYRFKNRCGCNVDDDCNYIGGNYACFFGALCVNCNDNFLSESDSTSCFYRAKEVCTHHGAGLNDCIEACGENSQCIDQCGDPIAECDDDQLLREACCQTCTDLPCPAIDCPKNCGRAERDFHQLTVKQCRDKLVECNCERAKQLSDGNAECQNALKNVVTMSSARASIGGAVVGAVIATLFVALVITKRQLNKMKRKQMEDEKMESVDLTTM